ncbi:MAG: hypothetical protein ACI8XM_000787 [Haloarculaceae archaeon]|jgi:uncharacterized protein with von Willebrand factor type A (vWA) domain
MFPTDSPPDGVPDVAGVRDDVVTSLVTFVRALRQAGVSVSSNATIVGTRALVEVGFDDRARARAALRASLVTRPGDVETFDRLFAEFWRRLGAHLDGTDAGGMTADNPDGRLAPLGAQITESDDVSTQEREPDRATNGPDRADGSSSVVTSALEPGPADDAATAASTATYSPAGQPETVTVELRALVDDEPLDAAVDRLVAAVGTLRGRRWQHASAGQRADARRALRRSVGTGGAIVSVPERARRETAVRTLVLADVSRSVLDTVDRAFLLRFLRTLTARVRHSRVFFFDSDVRDVSEAFDAPRTADAVRALERAETNWGGGTQIGHALTTVQQEYPDAIDRRTVVLVVSDGLEMGDVAALEAGMSRLSRQSRAVLWLNPLAASPSYEPTAAGMAAALPFVDGLFAFTDAADGVEIARQLEQYGTGGRIGVEHDPRRVRGTNGATGRQNSADTTWRQDS